MAADHVQRRGGLEKCSVLKTKSLLPLRQWLACPRTMRLLKTLMLVLLMPLLTLPGGCKSLLPARSTG